MASGGAEEEDGCVPLDIDNVHMLLQVEHEQIQKRTFTNWINAQLAKKCPPSFLSDLFSDLKDGSRLLDLLEVLSGQHMKRQRGRGVFQQRANIETALNFLKRKNVKLVNINIPDIIDGRPSIILGLVWTIILHCHIEELANALSFSSRHSSLDSLASLDSWSGSPVPSSPVPGGRASPLHRRFRVSAKKALLMWVRDQCQRVGCSISVKDFKASWRSGEAFLAILCALRPGLVDFTAVQRRSNRENLEEAFYLAEKELHIPRLLEPQDVDVKDPEEKSIMTYVAQFLQYSNDMPAPDDHEQASPSERAREVTCWLRQAREELSESWEAADKSSYTEKYQVFQSLAGSFSEQRKPVLTLLTSIRRCPELVQEQHALKAAWDRLEEELQRCKSDLDLSVPPPLDSVVAWLQRAEAVLTEEGDTGRDHAEAAKDARSQQEMLKTLCREMSHQVNTLDTFRNKDETGNAIVPPEKFDEIKRRLTNVRVTAKYQGIKLEYRESRHSVLDLLTRISEKLQVWRAPYVSQEAVHLLLQDWHETVERQGLLLILQDALQSLQRRTDGYTSKAALGDDSQLVCRQAKEAAGQAAAAAQATLAARAGMERAAAAWELYEARLGCLQAWLASADTQDVGEWASCHAQLNEAGNLLIEVTEAAVGRALAQQLSGVNMQWAEHMKRSVFEASPGPSAAPPPHNAVGPLVQEAGWLLKQSLQVSSLPLKANRQKMQLLLKKLTEMDGSSLLAADKENLQTVSKMLVEGEKSCGELQLAASRLEGGLAELQRWSSDSLDCQQKLGETEPRGRVALERSARALVSRGVQLKKQVMTDGEDLQNLVDHIQKASPLLHISAANLQERSSQAVCQCQEVLARFGSLGFQSPVDEIADVRKQAEGGSVVVAKTKHVEQAGSVKLQLIPSPGFLPSQSSFVKPHKEVQVETGGDVPPDVTQGPTSAPAPQTLTLPKPTTPSESPPVQRPKFQFKAATTEPSEASKRSKVPPRPPVMDRGEVLSRAQSMARSRLEKARFRLQGRIQQAIKLFGGRSISETQAKRKQRALKVLQPELLLEFLVAVDGYAAFCSETQLHELMLLSDSVRKQWEDVCSEMAEFVSILRSHIRLDKQSLSAAECEIPTNRTLHEAVEPLPQQQAATEGTVSVEEGVETLQQLCETLLPDASSCLPLDRLKESDETQERKTGDAALLHERRGRQLLGGPPPTATGKPADGQHNNNSAPSQEGSAASGWLGAVETQMQTQDAAEETRRPLMLSNTPVRSCMRAPSKEQALKAHVLHVTEANQQIQTHFQTVVRGDIVETKQEAEWTVIPEMAGAPPQQEALERCRTSFTVPQSQSGSDPTSESTRPWLHREQQREALSFQPELQYTQYSQFPQLVMGGDWEEAGARQVREQRRGGQMMKQTSRASVEGSSDLTEEQMALISEDLDRIIKRPVDISSWTSVDPRLISDLKDVDDKLPSETRKQSEERGGPEIPSSSSVCQLRRRLEPLQSASRSLTRFLAAAREARAEISNPLPSCDPSRRPDQAERERRSWHADVLERAADADGALKAAGMTLTLDGAAAMCWDLAAALLSQKVADTEKEATGARDERQLFVQQEPSNACDGEEQTWLRVKRSKLEDARRLGEEVLEVHRRRGRSSHREGKTSALIAALKELQAAAEQLGLQEPTLPALQQRTRTLRKIESQLASHLPELHQLRDAASPDGSQTSEVEKVWEETSKAVAERLEECGILTNLLKKFQSTRDTLSCTLQQAESTIGEQASYMGRDNLQRLHTKVQEVKAELNGLCAGIEEVRTTCRQLHTHLSKIPDCTANPFEGEADALMDRWLDISERTDSHLDNLHLALTLWDGVLKLGAELESRADNKLSVFAESPSFHSQEDIRALRNEIATQEESVERFHRRAAEIQTLLQSAELPLELQVVETQMRKKVEELQELVSDAEEVSQQMTATKKQISDRMSECCSSLQRIQKLLLSDAAQTPEKLEAVCVELQTQQKHAERLLEDVCVLASIASAESLHSLTTNSTQLQGELQATRQLYSELEETSRLQKMSVETAAKVKNPTFLEEETRQCRATSETLSLQKCSPQQASPPLVQLVEQRHNIRTGELDKEKKEAVNGVKEDAAEVLGVSVCDGNHLKLEKKETKKEVAGGFSLASSLRLQTLPISWPGSAEPERALQPRDSAEPPQPPARAPELQGVCCRLEEGVCDEERAARRELSSLRGGGSACQSSAGQDAKNAALQVALQDSIMDNLEVLTESSRQSVQTLREVETLAGALPGKREVLSGIEVQLDGCLRAVEADGSAAGSASTTTINSTGSSDKHHASTDPGESNPQPVATSMYGDKPNASLTTPTNSDAKHDTCAVELDPVHQENQIFKLREDHMESTSPQAQADSSKTDNQEAERRHQDITVIPNRVFTVVLDVDMQNHGVSGALGSLPPTPPDTPKVTYPQVVYQTKNAAENKSVVGVEGVVLGESFDPESKDMPRRCTAMMENTEAEPSSSLEATEEQHTQIRVDMEAAEVSGGIPALGGAGGSAGPEPGKQSRTMQDVLSEIQDLVEKGDVINRTPHIDLNWYLQSSPGEAEIRLVRTVQKVLACRYQPAQLDVTAMAKQLEEAEDYKRSVLDQVAQMKETGSARVCDPSVLKRVEAQWSAALLDASATVQVKAAQLDQVKCYHKQMKMAKAFLEVVAMERDKMSLNVLGSSALQAVKLKALLNTMAQKKNMWPELLRLSSQFSVHLSEAESSGALLAQLGDVQDEWRVLEGSIKRALRHASNSTSQASGLIKEVKQLKDKVEAVQESLQSSLGSCDTKGTLELHCLTTDLKLYNQLHLHLKSQSDALIHFSLGQKEKEEIKGSLQELGTLLNATNFRLNSMFSTVSLTKMSKHFQDLIIWAKQAEHHITVGKKLALFPEEARVQIVEMKKFQTDILTRRSKIQVEVEEMKAVTSDMVNEDHDQVLKTIEDLYEAITDSLDHVLNTMKKNLQEREKLLSQLANMDAWLAETHAKRDPCIHVENLSKADIGKLQNELKIHKLATSEIENQLQLVEAMEKTSKETAFGLSPGESRYLVNRLSGLWTELDGMLAHERATSWELEELIHERTSSDEELSNIWESLRLITMDLEQQKFPLTEETLSAIAQYKRLLMEHQCEVQEIQHCKEAKRSSLLCTIGELQDRCKAFSNQALEQDKYLHLRKHMEDSRDIAEEQIQRASEKTLSLGERFRLCQVLLVELPLVKTQCQEAADQLEAIAPELNLSDLNLERQRIHHTVETLVSWENSVLENIKHLESKLILGLRFSSELPALTEVFQRARLELQGAEPVSPDEKAIDVALRRCWVIWRNMESGMRVLEAMGRRDKINLKNLKELYSLRDSSMQECRLQMEGLSQARESLKDYQWAAQGAIGFLYNAETTFLSAPGGFLDCTEEQRQTQQAIEALEDGFQAHICHLGALVPKQPCLSCPKTEQLHTSILSQLLVGRAVLEAQAQLRLESLQRCKVRQESHKSCHEDVRQRLSGFETDLSECAAEHVTSYDKCIAQHKRAKVLMEDLRGLAQNIEELKAGCPMHGCAVGKGGELGALWRRWVSLRRGIGLFMAHTEQRGEEWRDITTSMEQCCSLLASLQAEVPDSSAVSFTQEKPQKLLAQAEMHQAGLEQEQQALASLEHRLEHALSLSSSQDPISPGPVGKTLVKIQENVRSLKERNLLVVAAAQAEEKERQQVEEKMEEVERHILDILPMLETCSDPLKQQEYTSDLFSQKAKMKTILDGLQIRYTEIPADISRRIQGIQQSLQGAEEKLRERSDSVGKLAGRVAELGSGLEKVKALLETKSSDISEAQNTLKRVWDELDMWHSRLMLLENEVQDVAEDQPEQAHVFMDQLMQPLQLYQSAAQMAEQRTAFLSKIPACLQEFEDILHSATCWSDEARSWLNAPVSFTTARSLQNHANSLQLVVDDSERIRDTLQNFRPVLAEISTVCDISLLESRLKQRDEEVHIMQKNILEPLEMLLHAVVVVEDMEAEILCMEKNIPKIRAILSSMDNSSITLSEHLLNRQVILANVQSMQKTLEEMQSCKAELRLPQKGKDGLVVFNKTGVLLQSLTELEELTQQQEAQLQDQIRLEAKSRKDNGVAESPCEETPQQECNSEEEGSEEDSSYLSSSSDTLTCSIPEDPDDTLNYSDLQSLCDVTGTGSLDPLGSEVKARSKGADVLELPPVTSELEIKNLGPAVTASTTMDSDKDPQLDTAETFLLKTASCELLAVPPAEEQLVNNAARQNHLSRDRGLTDMPVAAEQAVAKESTALTPERPIIPLSVVRTSASLGGREQSEVGSTDRILADESKPTDESPEVQSGSDYEGGQQRWHCLRAKISQKLSTLIKVQEEQEATLGLDNGAANGKVPDVELLSTGSASAVLQQTSESMDLLKSTVNSADGAREGVYVAAQRVLLCLDSLTDLLLTPRASAGDEAELKLMQLQCVSGELKDLCGLLGDVESESRARLEGEEPDAVLCLTSLQQCLQTAQLILTGAQSQTIQHSELQNEHQGLFSDQLCTLEEFELGPSEIFPNLKKEDAASIEQCMLGRHQSERTGEEELALQRASHSLLQGIAGVLELAEGWMMEEKMMCSSSSSQLQSALSKHKKLSQLLASQLAFAERLFHREPEVLRCQEDERVQLEVRAKAWQQQALQQEVAAQGRLQEWLCWEDSCGRMSRMLDELEGYISGGEPEGEEEEDEDTVVQSRAEACQQTLLQLDQSRASVGLMLDQGSQLQADAAKKTGGALELRWRNARRRTEREIQRCKDIQESRASFQTDSAHVGEWLLDANKRLKTWLDLAGDTEPNPASVRRSLIELLEFSSEIEAASAQRTSASRAASRLLHLRDADCPRLRAHLAKLEVGWSQLTSDLSTAQDALQQRLLAVWPPAELLSDVEIWMKKLEERLKQEREALLKAKDAAEMWRSLRRHQKRKAGMLSAQVLLDFLSQMGPQVSDVQALRAERTAFAEQLGALRLRWLHLQGELESQIRRAEQIHHTCAVRERKLRRLSSSVEQRQKQLNQWKRAGSRTLAHRALLELEAVLGNLKEEAKALQELRATPWLAGDEEAEEKERPCKVAFSAQAECVAQAFEDLSQQVEALQPALQQTVEEWARLHQGLRDVSLLTTRVRCALHRPTTPLLSMQQTQRYVDFLPCLQETTGEAEQLWAGLDESYQNLKANLHPATAETLRAKIEGERERWSEALQELCEEQRRSRETLSLWQEHERLSHSCSHRLKELQGQWAELQRGGQVTPQALEVLQGAAEDLQSSVGDVLTSSKPLAGRLEPLAASLVQSETRLLSRDILLLSQDTSAKKKSLQEDEAQQREFVPQLEKLEKQIQNILPQKKATHKDSVKQQLSELSELFPSLLDTLNASRWLSLSDQQAETLRRLISLWNARVSPMCDAYRNQLKESQRSLDIENKCAALTSVLEELEKLESASRQPKNYSYPQKILSDCQKLQMDVMAGQQLFQGLSCDAVIRLEKQTGEERSELLAQVSRLRERWFRSVSLIAQWKVSAKEQLKQWRIYQRGSKLLWKLLRDVGPLLPPTGPVRSTLQQLRSHAADCQCVEDALRRHAPVYTQTLEAGRHLCDSVTEPESLSRLQSELQAIDEAWRSSNSLLEKTGTLINTTTQKWSQCQDRITSITSELDMLKAELKKQLPAGPEQTEEEEQLIQKTGHSLQLLSGGLGELVTMKSDLSQYVAAGDSALLEQQLEQLHGQWEELCSKVSLRRQEIADRLNAWTIFNDKNKEFCDWLTQMENKVCHSGELSIEEMVEKLKKDCMEEINLFSENKSHLKQLGEQLLLASDEAKQTQVRGSLQELNQRWHGLFHQIEARVRKLKETLVTVQQLDKNMSNLRSWLSRIEAELSRPITYSVCHHQEIQKRLAEQQELQRDIEQHTEGVASVLSLCDVLLRDEDAAVGSGGAGSEAESDSLQETSRSLDQRWRTICALALERRLRIEETWRLWCKFLDDYSRFEDWLKMAERTAANPNSGDVLYTVAKEELKKFEGFQRQVHERLTQLELVNNQYRRLARENRTDRASQLKAMVHEGNRRWDALHRRAAAILRRLKYFTSQREEFESTRESMLVWLTELDLQLTNVEHFSESDVHHKIQQLNSFQKEITLNTERIDGLIVFGEGLIQRSTPSDAVLIEEELEELHSYCQDVFSRLVRFHQRLSQPPAVSVEPELYGYKFSLESSLELIGRPWLGRSQGSLPATPSHLLASPLERSGRETPVSVDSLPLEWDHTGDVGGSSSHEDEEEEEQREGLDEDGTYFSAISEAESTLEDFVEAAEMRPAAAIDPSCSMDVHGSPQWRSPGDGETEAHVEAQPTLTSTPLKQGYLRLMSQCSGSIESIKRVSLILDEDDDEVAEDRGLTRLRSSDKQSGVIERWELLQAQSRSDLRDDPQEPQTSDLEDLTSWLEGVIPQLERLQQVDPGARVDMAGMEDRAKELKEMQKAFARYKSIMLSVNLRALEPPEQQRLGAVNRDWSRACTGLQQWDTSLRRRLMRCQEFHETLHSLLLWLAHADSRRYAVDVSRPDTPPAALRQHLATLTSLQEELRARQAQQAALQALWAQLQPDDGAQESAEAQEKIHVTGCKLKLLLREVGQELSGLQRRLECESPSGAGGASAAPQASHSKKTSPAQRARRESSPRRSFFSRVLRAAFPLHLLLLLLLLLPCLLLLLTASDHSCSEANNFARSFYPMLRYTNGPPPT